MGSRERSSSARIFPPVASYPTLSRRWSYLLLRIKNRKRKKKYNRGIIYPFHLPNVPRHNSDISERHVAVLYYKKLKPSQLVCSICFRDNCDLRPLVGGESVVWRTLVTCSNVMICVSVEARTPNLCKTFCFPPPPAPLFLCVGEGGGRSKQLGWARDRGYSSVEHNFARWSTHSATDGTSPHRAAWKTWTERLRRWRLRRKVRIALCARSADALVFLKPRLARKVRATPWHRKRRGE